MRQDAATARRAAVSAAPRRHPTHYRIGMKHFAALLLLASVIAPALAQSTFHGNVARTGVYQSTGPARLTGIRWAFNTGGPIVGSPAIADGVVYIASLSGHLFAIDQSSGTEKWKFKSRMPIASSPAVMDGILYFVSSTGSLAALDIATGQPKWVFPGGRERQGVFRRGRRQYLRGRRRERHPAMEVRNRQWRTCLARRASSCRRCRHVRHGSLPGARCEDRPPALALRCEGLRLFLRRAHG